MNWLPGYHHDLVTQFLRRDLQRRYRGSLLGAGWAIVTPVVMLVLYTIVFTGVFGVSWPGRDGDSAWFAIMMFTGMVCHGMFSECLQRSPGSVLVEAALARKVAFPLESLAWVTMLDSAIHALMGIGVLLVALLWLTGSIPYTALLAPLVWLPFTLICVGVSWLFGAAGVYFRDLAQLSGFLSAALLFLSPVFYSVDRLPAFLKPWVYVNPLTIVIEQTRRVVIDGQPPDWLLLGAYSVVAVIVFSAGLVVFRKLARGFADVL